MANQTATPEEILIQIEHRPISKLSDLLKDKDARLDAKDIERLNNMELEKWYCVGYYLTMVRRIT